MPFAGSALAARPARGEELAAHWMPSRGVPLRTVQLPVHRQNKPPARKSRLAVLGSARRIRPKRAISIRSVGPISIPTTRPEHPREEQCNCRRSSDRMWPVRAKVGLVTIRSGKVRDSCLVILADEWHTAIEMEGPGCPFAGSMESCDRIDIAKNTDLNILLS